MNTVNNAANLSWDQGTNLTTAERPPVDIFCGMTDIFKEDFAQRKCEDTSFHHLRYTYLWNAGLLLKTQESGKVVNGDQILTYTAFLHQTLPVNSQVFPVLKHMWLYCCPLTVVSRSQRWKKKKKRQSSTSLRSRHGTRSTDTLWGNTICYIFIAGFASS